MMFMMHGRYKKVKHVCLRENKQKVRKRSSREMSTKLTFIQSNVFWFSWFSFSKIFTIGIPLLASFEFHFLWSLFLPQIFKFCSSLFSLRRCWVSLTAGVFSHVIYRNSVESTSENAVIQESFHHQSINIGTIV